MASLKEIKGRIGSVEGTLKITSAMKLVASAKLHKAQMAIESMLPYDRQLHKIMVSLLSGETKVTTPLCHPHGEVERVAIVTIASNSSLCGGYNSNSLRHTTALLHEYAAAGLTDDAIDCYVIGRKLSQSLGKMKGFNLIRDYVEKTFAYDLSRTLDEIRPTFSFDETCQRTVPEAITCFIEGKDYEDVVRLSVTLAGDADTIAAIAGSVSSAVDDVPNEICQPVISLLSEELCTTLLRFNQLVAQREHEAL